MQWGNEDEDNIQGVMVWEQDNLRINWLPFDADEAEYLAFGTRVPEDALPAYVTAVRLRDGNPGFHADPASALSLIPV